jgi:hypothetical protein
MKALKEEIRRTNDPDLKEKLSAPLTLLESMNENLRSQLTLLDTMGPPMNLVASDKGEVDRLGGMEKPTAGPAPGVVRMAFVNDGKIVLVRADGTLIQTDLQGENPSLSSDGRSLTYTRIRLLDKVIPTLATHPRYGLTFRTDGIYLLNLASGQQTQVVDDADDACLAPDCCNILFTQNDVLFVRNLGTGSQQIIGKGRNACWLGDDAILYENDFLVYRYDITRSQSQELLQPLGVRLTNDIGKDATRLKMHVFAGTTLSAQMCLCSFAGGQKAAFAQWEASITSGQKMVLVTVGDQQLQTSPLLEVRGPDFNLNALNEMAVSPDGKQVAYMRPKKISEMIPPEKIATAADGTRLGSISHINTDGPDNLYVAKLASSPDHAPETAFLDGYLSVSRLAFWDNQILLVETCDTRQRSIELGDGTMYLLGVRALDPEQLAMMGLDAKLTGVDLVHRIDLKTEQSQVWFSEHGFCVALSNESTAR